jgi:hypothetical protein
METAAGDEMKLARVLEALQSPGHEETLDSAHSIVSDS